VRADADVRADLRAALATAQAALAAERNARAATEAALAEAKHALSAVSECRAADQEWAATRRQQWQAELSAERAALADARRALANERECRAADQELAAARAAARRQQWLEYQHETFRDCIELAVLARGAGVSSPVVDFWYRAPAPAEPEPDPEPNPE
jgi:hypothetical protein